MEYVLLFFASFFQVFLLGLNSQIVRDRLVALAFFVSWGIWTGQFFFTRITANADEPVIAYFSGGLGGALGIASSILFYDWFSHKTAIGRKLWRRQ